MYSKKIFLILYLCVIVVGIGERVQAQTDETTYKITTTDHQTLIGTLIFENDSEVRIETKTAGRITIQKKNIARMEILNSESEEVSKYGYESPLATRYFFAPNAIGLDRGKGYYQNTWVLFNNAHYGITDHISIGGGLIPLFLFGTSETPIWLMPKFTIPVSEDVFSIGAGAMIGGLVGSNSGGLGVFYGLGTLGNRDKNVTVGIGYGYAGTEVSSSMILNVSGSIRLSRRIYLMTESYFVPEVTAEGIISLGIRWASESFAIDVGLFRPTADVGDLIGIPWLSVTFPFGN